METYTAPDGKKFTKDDSIVLTLNTTARQYGLYHIDIYLVLITHKAFMDHQMDEVFRKYAIVDKDKCEVLYICDSVNSIILYLDLLKALQDGFRQTDTTIL